MFDVFRAPPRRMSQLDSTGVAIKQPLEMPPPDKRPAWQRFMPLIMVTVMVGMFSMFIITGTRAITSMMYTMPMMVMMLVMHAGMNRGAGSSSGDIAQEVEEYDLQLREDRARIHEQGRDMHSLRTTCFPHPDDLTSLVGRNEMWQADPDPDIGRVVPPHDESDPDVKHLTSNPYLRARVGIGVAPLYPKLIAAEDVVPEMLEPATLVRYQQAMNTLSVVANIPIDVRLDEYPAYAMRGDEAPRLGLVRAMIMSLAFNHKPSDLNIGVITDDPASWEWIKWLPHAEDLTRVEKGLGARLLTWRSIDEFAACHAAQIERMRSDNDADRPPHLLLIVDTPEQVVAWPPTMTGGLRGMTWLVTRYGSDEVCDENSSILIAGGRVSTIEDFDAAAADSASITLAGTFARAMYRYRPRGYGIGAVVDDKPEHIPGFFEVLNISDIEAHDIVKVWKENAFTDEIKVPYGYRRNGDELTPEITHLNFYEVNRQGDGPHGAVAGQTGSGKSYFLRSVVLSLIAKYGPDKVALILADFKGGATFLGMKGIPHVVANISNLENATELVDRLGEVLQGEVLRRETFITQDRGCKDIYEYRAEQKKRPNDPGWPPVPDLIIIIDECGQFLKERKDYLALLTEIGRVGRSLGMHLMICSQFIDKTMIGDLYEHLNFRYSLQVNSQQHSIAMIGTAAAADMVSGKLKGKIFRRFKSDAEPVEVVSFHHEGEYVRRVEVERSRTRDTGEHVTDAVVPFSLFTERDFTPVVDGDVIETREEQDGDSQSTKMSDVLLQKVGRLEDMRNPTVENMWLPSLREPMSLPELDLKTESSGLSIRIGDIDAPQKQKRLPWFMNLEGGLPHQAIAGAPKSGRTTLLQTLVICGCLQFEPARLMFMLADYGSGKLAEVKNSPNVAAYARPGDAETVTRILGEAKRLIELRTTEMVERETYNVDSYIASKHANPVNGDPYGHVVVAIDGIGGFLGSEDRADRAKLLRPILDSGAGAGVHLVFTADTASSSSAGNAAHYTMEPPGGIQLPSSDYTGAKMSGPLRQRLKEIIPVDQPGRSVDVVTELQARTVIPISREIEPDDKVNDREIFKVHDHGEEIARLCERLREVYASQIVTPVLAADPVIDYEIIWSVFESMVDFDRNPARTIIPLGSAMDTLALSPIPNFSQNLLVYGEKGCGKTNALRCVMEAVMRQYRQGNAVIIVIDPLRGMMGERDRLYERGYMRPPKNSEPQADGSVKRIRPPGYVTSAEDMKATAEMLVQLMGSRRPTDDTTVDQLQNRTYFEGPEVYVFIDNFSVMAEGYMAKTMFDEVTVGDQTVSKLLATGDDLGVHFIVATGTEFSQQVESSPFMKALRNNMMSPILQLAAPPGSGMPVKQAQHLKPMRWRPGQGRIIVDEHDYTTVQTARFEMNRV